MRYIEQKLTNWGHWIRQREDNGLGYGNSPLANMMARVARSESGDNAPVIEVEAAQTDEAVRRLERHLQEFAMLWYAYNLPVRTVAQRMGCSTTTVPRRIEEVVLGVKTHLEQREEVRLAVQGH